MGQRPQYRACACARAAKARGWRRAYIIDTSSPVDAAPTESKSKYQKGNPGAGKEAVHLLLPLVSVFYSLRVLANTYTESEKVLDHVKFGKDLSCALASAVSDGISCAQMVSLGV